MIRIVEKASGFLSEYTPWAFFMIDIISEHGFVPGVFDVGQSFGLLIERFKCYWKHFLRPAFPTLEDDYNATKHCTCFGLSTLSACPLHLKLRNPKALWSILIQASLYCNKESTGLPGIVDPIGSLIGTWCDILQYVLPSNACLLEFVIAIGFEMLACKVYKRGKKPLAFFWTNNETAVSKTFACKWFGQTTKIHLRRFGLGKP